MKNVGRVSAVAVLLVIALRLSIGWQLMYEGLWKIKTLHSPNPWTAEGYLKNSVGPLRNTFRAMTGDPNDLDWLDADKVAAKWDDWRQRFVNHYQLDSRQQGRLNALLDPPPQYAAELDKLPEAVDFSPVNGREKKIRFDAEKKRLLIESSQHLLPSEYQELKDAVAVAAGGEPSEEVAAYLKALDAVYDRSRRLTYKERVRAALLGDADITSSSKLQQIGELEKYRILLNEYEKSLAEAREDFHYVHLAKLWSDIQAQRASLVNPIKALDAELKTDAMNLLSIEQLQRGAPPQPWTPLRITDTLTIAGLTVLGFLLIVGLFTRCSALLAALMLFSFYMAMPPLPGLPDPPGTEHSLIVNKNLIEVVALLAIATLPTGSWFGLDRVLLHWFAGRGRAAKKTVGKMPAAAVR